MGKDRGTYRVKEKNIIKLSTYYSKVVKEKEVNVTEKK